MEPTETDKQLEDYLFGRPGLWCPGKSCYVHPEGWPHHAPDCIVSETFEQIAHRSEFHLEPEPSSRSTASYSPANAATPSTART